MAEVNLVSTLAMGAVLLGIVIAISRARSWQRAPATAGVSRPSVGDAATDPRTWSAAFVLLTMAVALAAIAYVGGSLPPMSEGLAGTLLFGSIGLLLALFLGAGSYAAAQNRGLPESQAAAIGSIVLGVLLLVAITLKLFLGL